MLGDRLFGVSLHLVVDGRIDLEAVLVQVVRLSVGLGVLVEPAVEVVRRPKQGVGGEILAELIVRATRLLGVHHPPQHVPEIGAVTGIVVLHLVGQLDGNLLDGVPLGLGQVTGLLHLGNDEIAPGKGLVGVERGIVARGFVDHADQRGALLDRQVRGFLVEEGLRGGLDAVGVASEEDGVEIHVEDLFLGVFALQLDRGDPFLQLDPYHVDLVPAGNLAVQLLAGIQGLGELLGDGGSAALVGLAHEEGLEEHAAQTLEVDAGMPLEAGVLRRDGRMDQVLGQILVSDEGSVLYVEGCQGLAILGDDLRSQLAVRVLQLLERGDLGKQPHHQQHEEQGGEGDCHQDPEPLGYFLFRFVFHIVARASYETQN